MDALHDARRERRRGALLGLALGDALGTTLEFTTPDAPAFPTLAHGPHTSVTGGGPFGVAPGQITDDTQMAVCLATSLLQRGRYDVEHVAHAYVRWRPHAFDIGQLTASALDRIAAGAEPMQAGYTAWEASGRRSAGNGSLMRTAPIAVWYWNDPESRRLASLTDSAITHADPRCQLACAAFNASLAEAITGGPIASIVAAGQHEIDAAAQMLASQKANLGAQIEDARRALHHDLEHAQRADPDLYGDELHLHRSQGFVRVAFRLAFWELAHAPSLREGLIDTVNRGGDADTNGAIAGALLGAHHGAAAIPEAWVSTVMDALAGQAGPLAQTYHPRALLALVA